MTTPHVELAIRDSIATLTLQGPKGNSLSSAMLQALDDQISEVEANAEVRGVVIAGSRGMFCAGASIEEISRLDRESGLLFARRGQSVLSRIENLLKPVIAAVDGYALGGGCELALACHVRIASHEARLGQPEVRLGILPGFGGTQRLPRLVGRGAATKLILMGRKDNLDPSSKKFGIAAEEALRIGLVDEVCSADRLLARCTELLGAMLMPNGPLAVAAALRAIRDGIDLPLPAALELEAQLFAEACGTPEMQEGTSAFLEKQREPGFSRVRSPD